MLISFDWLFGLCHNGHRMVLLSTDTNEKKREENRLLHFRWKQINICYLELWSVQCTLHMHQNLIMKAYANTRILKNTISLYSNVNRTRKLFSCARHPVCTSKQEREREKENERKKWQPETINSKRKSKIDLRSNSLWCCVSAYKLCTHQTILISSPSIYIVSTLWELNEKKSNREKAHYPNQNVTENSRRTHSILQHTFMHSSSSSHSMCLLSLITFFLVLARFHKRRNYLKSDMQKVLVFYHRLRTYTSRSSHSINTIFFGCVCCVRSSFLFAMHISLHIPTICIRQASRHANTI